MAITSVDGLNVITGKKAGFDQQGYVLNPHETTVVDGWRKSMNNTAAFYFTNIADTYAARTYNNIKNVGVIGVACFAEKMKRLPVQPMAMYNDSIAARESASSKQELGTGHGEIIYSPITTTTFEKSSHKPERTINIYYDSYRNLVKRGVIPQNRCRKYGNYDMCMDDEPIAFPQEPQFEFAPDPKR